jgi:hypothetical protein
MKMSMQSASWFSSLAVLLLILTCGCNHLEQRDTTQLQTGVAIRQYSLTSGDLFIVKTRAGKRGEEFTGYVPCDLFIQWKANNKTEQILGTFPRDCADALKVVTNQDYLVLILPHQLQWRKRSEPGRWKHFHLPNTHALCLYTKQFLDAHSPGAYTIYQVGGPFGYEIIRVKADSTNPRSATELDDHESGGIPFQIDRIDFAAHQMIATPSVTNKFLPQKLIFTENNNQFGTWKFDPVLTEKAN